MNKTGLYSLVFGIALAIPFGLATVQTSRVIAQDRSGTNMTKEEGEETPESKAVSELMLAQQLAAYGRENDSATALISAAEIVLNTPTQEASFDKTMETEDSQNSGTNTTKTSTESPDLSVSELLDEARTIADGDQNLLNMINDLESRGTPRGRVGGPAKDIDAVDGYSRVYYDMRFQGRRNARIGVQGDGDTDLDCYIYDSNGNLITSDTDYSDTCTLGWVPNWTGPFRLVIRNRGGVYNRYVMLTN